LNKHPLVSIITPVFNQKTYFEKTIRSVLSQTYQNWEWIILDDGSTDGTGEIIKDCKDSRIQYIFQENAGISRLTKTYNKALQKCNGELIAMLDHDDYWPDYKLGVQVKHFNDPTVVLSYGECWIVNHQGKRISFWRLQEDTSIANNDPVGSSLKGFFFKRYSFIPNLTVMVRRAVLQKIGGFVEAKDMYHDFPTWLQFALEGKFSSVPVCLGYYRKHPSAVTFDSNQELRINVRINFFREFLFRNKTKLNELGFFYDIEMIENYWEGIKREHIHFDPYNKSLLMLKLGLFKDAQSNFQQFLGSEPSSKNRLIHSLLMISKFFNYDIVNPVANLKERLWKYF
jgi:glycosyltransferase involved in cell wall biosynthesis